MGFNKILVFFDEEKGPAQQLLNETLQFGDMVKVFTRGDALNAMWSKTKLWRKVGAFVQTEVMARQVVPCVCVCACFCLFVCLYV